MKHLFILSMVFLLIGCEGTPATDETCISVVVQYQAEAIDQTFDACVTSVIAEDFILSIEDELQLELVSSSFGNYVAGLMGYNFETLGMSAYWAIYLNDEYAPVGISELEVANQDTLLFIVETY